MPEPCTSFSLAILRKKRSWCRHFSEGVGCVGLFLPVRNFAKEWLCSSSFQPQKLEPLKDAVHVEDDPVLQCEVRSFVVALRACAKRKDLCQGIRLHNDVLERGLLTQCADALVTMYAKCGQLARAKELLELHKSNDVFSWTDLIGGYARSGQGRDALECFACMLEEGPRPNAATFTCVLKACGHTRSIEKGEQIYNEISKQHLLENDIVLGNALIDMYVKCGCLEKARSMLNNLPVRDVVSWSTLIAGYAQQGRCKEALNCLHCMQDESILPDNVTLTCVLNACAVSKEYELGEQIHDEIIRRGLLGTDGVLGNALVDMYAKCGCLAKAWRVLKELPARDVVSWSALIAGYAEAGQGQQALHCFEQMRCERLSPDSVVYANILKVCGSMRAAEMGEKVYNEIIQLSLLKENIVLGNALVDMFIKCRLLIKARSVLEELPARDVVTWSTIIAGYAQHGQGEQAMECFERMQAEGISPNVVTFICVLKACGSLGALDKGHEIHDEVVRQGLLRDNIMLGNAVVDMFAKCGNLEKAHHVLEELPVNNVVSWNALISGYSQHGQAEQAFDCFELMQHKGIKPDSVTFLGILKACSSIGALRRGEKIHKEVAKLGLLSTNIVLGNAVVSMYAKCGALTKAEQVLDSLPNQDTVAWNALIAGYIEEGQAEEALRCYEQMQEVGLSPNLVTFLSILKACATVGACNKGRQIHDEMARQGLLGSSLELSVALVDMYVKSGDLEKASCVLRELHIQNVASWNSVIGGYAQQGNGEQSLRCFDQMQQEGLRPDAATLVSVLKAYGLVGHLDDAQSCFLSMTRNFGVTPHTEHYMCLFDILGRAGQLDQAVAMHTSPTLDCSSELFSTLLNACQKWGDVSVAKWAFEQLLKVGRPDVVTYVLMAKIYADAGMEVEAKKLESVRCYAAQFLPCLSVVEEENQYCTVVDDIVSH